MRKLSTAERIEQMTVCLMTFTVIYIFKSECGPLPFWKNVAIILGSIFFAIPLSWCLMRFYGLDKDWLND